jgi:membrane protease YdiL (CAAX protease family)
MSPSIALRGVWVVVSLAMSVSSADAEDSPGSATDVPSSPGVIPSEHTAYSRAAVIGVSTTSAALSLSPLVLDIIPIRQSPWFLGAQARIPLLMSPTPLFAIDTGEAFAVNGSLWALEVAESAAIYGYSVTGRSGYKLAASFADVSALHVGFYGAYAIYRDMRLRCRSLAYADDGWKPQSFLDLLDASFHPANYEHWLVAMPIAAAAQSGALLILLGIAADLATPGARISVNAGSVVLGVGEGVVLGLMAGVTEEALFRGFIYEELKHSIGKVGAHIADAVLFSAAHVPETLALESSVGSPGLFAVLVALGVLSRAGFAVLADFAYDQGGLQESVPLHAAWDTILFLAEVAVTGKGYLPGSVIRSNVVAGTSRTPTIPVPTVQFSF